MLSQAVGLVLLLVGCPSPEQAPGTDNPWASPPGAAAPAASPPTAAPAGAGLQAAPASDGSSAAAPPSDGPCQPAAYALESHPSGSPMITISGSVDGATTQGTMLIELVDPAERMSRYGVACPMASSFSFAAPADLGEVVLAVFIDGNGNGPDSVDIAGRYDERLQVAGADISELAITVAAAADLGDIPPPYSMPGAPSSDGVPAGAGVDGKPGGPSGDGLPPASGAGLEPGSGPLGTEDATNQGANPAPEDAE